MLRHDRKTQRRHTALANLKADLAGMEARYQEDSDLLKQFNAGKASLPCARGTFEAGLSSDRERMERKRYEIARLEATLLPITGTADSLRESALRAQKRGAYHLEDCLDDMQEHAR